MLTTTTETMTSSKLKPRDRLSPEQGIQVQFNSSPLRGKVARCY